MGFIFTILKGFSEVFFQENALFGIFILVGLAIASPIAAIFAVIGNITATLVGYMLPVNKQIVDIGVYGFNGVLVGTAVAFYLKSNLPLAILFVILGSLIAALIFYFLSKHNITPFALPFVIVALSILFLSKFLKI